MEVQHNTCPKCGCNRLDIFAVMDKTGDHVCVGCKKCRFKGPLVRTKAEAWLSWDIAMSIIKQMEKEGDAMKKHEPCPVCGEANVEVKEGDIRGEHEFRAVCGNCGWSGPAYNNLNDALLRWDDIAKQIRRHADSKRTPENVDVVKHIDAVLMMNAEKKRAEKKNATRKEILDAAATCVCKERNDQYGEPEDCFQDIANLWAAYKGTNFDSFDVAMMMSLLKVARAKANPQHTDNYIDLCGYGSIAGELANKEENE